MAGFFMRGILPATRSKTNSWQIRERVHNRKESNVMIQMFTALAIALPFNCAALAQVRDKTIMEGDQIAVSMTGDLAKEYAKATGVVRDIKQVDGLTIKTMATVEQRLTNGQIRIEHSSQVNQVGKTPRLVTLTATIATSKVTSEVTPTGTKVFASPGSKDKGITTNQSEMLRTSLSDLKGLKLRTWTLATEVGQ
jgi:TRAP-type mannitol/chloroaromatic compound transport system substrate-binding protein